MVFSAKANQLIGPSTTGTNATTDPGFQPKGLLLWNGLQTTAGATAGAQWSLGFAGSASTDVGAGYNSADNVTNSDVVHYFNTARSILNFNAGTVTNNLVADVSSFDASGFTVNWSTLVTTSPKYHYLALGGSAITNVKSGSFAAPTIVGNQSVTGVGFQPDVVIFFTNNRTTSGQANSDSEYGIGAATSSSARWALGISSNHNQTTTETWRMLYTNRCIVLPLDSGTINNEADLVSMDTDGFTVNWTSVDAANNWLVGYLAIKGGQWKVGTETQGTTVGTKATTGVGFRPKGVIFGSHCADTTGSIIDHARLMFGVTTGIGNNVCQWTGDRDASVGTIANTIMSNNKCLVMATEGSSATPTTQAEAALSSFDSDGFTVNWTTADATARTFGYVAFGDTPVVPAGNALFFGINF